MLNVKFSSIPLIVFVFLVMMETLDRFVEKVKLVSFQKKLVHFKILSYVDILSYLELENPCVPSPCGPNSICRVLDGRTVCSCQANYYGPPPNCRVECMMNSDCSRDKACRSSKCTDPCIGTCGQNAICKVVNHSPICSCSSGFTGDPFEWCRIERKTLIIWNWNILQNQSRNFYFNVNCLK